MIFFRPSIIRFLLGIGSLILCVGLVRSLYTQVYREDVVAQRQQGIMREQARNQELKRKLKEATSSAFIEKLAREKLGLVKEGDTVVLLDTSHLQSNGGGQNNKLESNWSKWWSLFF